MYPKILSVLRRTVPFCQDSIGNLEYNHHIGYGNALKRRTVMQTNNKFFDDMSKVMTNAMGVAQGAKDEAETAMKSWIDRWMADRDFVTREEFDAVKLMATKAREENAALSARLDALEAKKTTKKPAAKKTAAKK